MARLIHTEGESLKKLAPGLLAGTAALALSITVLQPAQANPAERSPHEGNASVKNKRDNRPGPMTKKQQKQRAKALALLESGKADLVQRREGATVALGDGTFAEFPIEKTDNVFTVLSEFGDQGSGRLGTTPGPEHNQIPKPDRSKDNSTYWQPDFSKAHYEEMFNGDGESFKNYYLEQSSGRYTALNTVTDWVKVPGNASSYGDNVVEDNGGTWAFVDDSLDAWYDQQLAANKTKEDIEAELAKFDTWDRYDWNGNGNFNEPDGYIDHFQAVHAGEGEEAGADPDMIWSHRWYVQTGYGTTGPTVGDKVNKGGGAQIGDTNFYVGDYTVEPENGGLGVFAHEFAHDLGVPDYYDTAGGENGTGFWTLMSSGSWLSHGPDAAAGEEGTGTVPNGLGPEEKLFLGWLDYTEVDAGESGTYKLGPSQNTYADADQALKVNLPPSGRTTKYTTPPEGSHAWWTGRGDDLENTLTREVPAASSVTVKAKAWYDIEAGYDYLYAQYSLDDGENWTTIGSPLDGSSKGRWAGLRYSYKPNGQPSLFRFLYKTDSGYNLAGAFLDSISVGSFTDGAENGANGWTADGAKEGQGWTISTGTDVSNAPRYYLIENRQYVGYDETLAQGPYQYSFGMTAPNKVEWFPYQDGMLVWLVDHAYLDDNNVSQHLGAGYALPVDASPNSLTYPDGTSPTNRREPYDATFGLDQHDPVCLSKEVPGGTKKNPTVETLKACGPTGQQQATFDDTLVDRYYSADAPQNSVKVANVGVTATVTADDGQFLTVDVANPAAQPTP